MLALLFASVVCAASAIPEDLYAFPKYRVAFLNGLPVANATAERWLAHGLPGGAAEFLEQWSEIGAPDAHDPPQAAPTLELMRLGARAYVCLVPPAPALPPPPADDAAPGTPSHSWALLQPLAGSCLYHRQGWFTYSYCHNLHVRQFRELPVQFPHPPGGRAVEEDPEWESYTLGRSPASRTSAGGALTVNDARALADNLELARQGAGQRYLVQRWADGTPCDKTGRPRAIEVQFHCSMTMTDTVMFVKETRTCEYVLVVHTPRLCGEPGFKSRLAQLPAAALRCRAVAASDADAADPTLPEAPAPAPFARRAPPAPAPAPAAPAAAPRGTLDRAQDTAKLLRRALEALLGRGDGDGADAEAVRVYELAEGDAAGEFVVELDVDSAGEGAPATGRALADVLRAAGYTVKGEKGEEEEDTGRRAADEL